MNVLIDYAYRAEELAALPINELALFVIGAQDLPADTEVSISFVDDKTMADLNGKYRGTASATDVLSFECDNLDDGFSPCNIPSEFSDPYQLGDVVIAPDVAERQCKTYETSFEGEISLLLVHGLLHLCGYDHVNDGDAHLMEARERDLLRQWADTGHEAVRHVRDE